MFTLFIILSFFYTNACTPVRQSCVTVAVTGWTKSRNWRKHAFCHFGPDTDMLFITCYDKCMTIDDRQKNQLETKSITSKAMQYRRDAMWISPPVELITIKNSNQMKNLAGNFRPIFTFWKISTANLRRSKRGTCYGNVAGWLSVCDSRYCV